MTWEAVRTETDPVEAYNLLKRHRLLPKSEVLAATICNVLGAGDQYIIQEDGARVADVFVTGAEEGQIAQLDLVPVVRYFRTGFDDLIRGALMPVIRGLFYEDGVRKIEAEIPASRPRTKRALCALGFRPEGRKREGVELFGAEPEDLRVLGLLKSEIKEQEDG